MLYYFIILILAILFDPFTSISLTVTAAVLIAWNYKIRPALIAAFILGILVDIAAQKTLGVSSLILLGVAGITLAVSQILEAEMTWVLIILAVIAEAVWQLYFSGSLTLNNLLLQAIATGLLWFIGLILKRQEGVYLKT
jgi:cell shape-determining protein MreD